MRSHNFGVAFRVANLVGMHKSTIELHHAICRSKQLGCQGSVCWRFVSVSENQTRSLRPTRWSQVEYDSNNCVISFDRLNNWSAAGMAAAMQLRGCTPRLDNMPREFLQARCRRVRTRIELGNVQHWESIVPHLRTARLCAVSTARCFHATEAAKARVA